MVQYACANLPFSRLEAMVFAWNLSSMRVLEKTGFVRDGVLHHNVLKDGTFTDSVVYAHIMNV